MKTPKSKKSPSPKIKSQSLSLEKDIEELSKGGPLTGKGVIERDFCGHNPEVSISCVPQWVVEYNSPVNKMDIKLIFETKHQMCYFFSAKVTSERLISSKDPTTVDFKTFEIMKNQQIFDVELSCSPTNGEKHIIGLYATLGNPIEFGFVIKDNPPITLKRLKYLNDMPTSVIVTEKPWHIGKTKKRSYQGHNPGLFTCKQYLMHFSQPGTVCLEVYAKSQPSLSNKIKGTLLPTEQGFATEEDSINSDPLLLVIQEGRDRINHEKENKKAVFFKPIYTHDLFFFEAKEGDYVLCPCLGNSREPESLSLTLHAEGKTKCESFDLSYPNSTSCNIDLDGDQQFVVTAKNENEDAIIYVTFRPDTWAVVYLNWEDDEGFKSDYIISSSSLRNDNPEYFLKLSAGKKLIITIATKNGGYKIGEFSLMVSSRTQLSSEISKDKIDLKRLGNVHKDLPKDNDNELDKENDEVFDKNNEEAQESKACILI